MLNFNEKFICIFDKETSKHYLTTTELELDTVYTGRSSKSFYTGDSCERNLGEVQPMTKLTQNYKSKPQKQIKVVNFRNIFHKLGIVVPKQIKKEIYLPELDKYCDFKELSDVEDCVPIQCIQMTIILIRLSQPQILSVYECKDHKIIQENVLCYKQNKQNLSKVKQITQSHQIKERDRNRSIGQIMNFVRTWRQLAEKGINGTRLNLQQAAAYVGIPKKSLDDYFYQLRAAEKYDFDFSVNLDKNISYLRKFVKQKIPSRQKQSFQTKFQKSSDNADQNQTIKLPKKLKQYHLQQAKTDTHCDKQLQIQKEHQDQKLSRLSDSEVSSIQHIWPNLLPKNSNDIYDDEDSFFKDFKGDFNGLAAFDHIIKNSTQC